jgi:hypothetical protein
MSDLATQLQQAKTDLAFALAQGDGYAEDNADRRIKELQAAIGEDAKLGRCEHGLLAAYCTLAHA